MVNLTRTVAALGLLALASTGAFAEEPVQKEVHATEEIPDEVSKEVLSTGLLLRVNRIIPDVVNDFAVSIELNVVDARGPVPTAAQVEMADVTVAPKVTFLQWNVTATKLYTIVMTDPGVLPETEPETPGPKAGPKVVNPSNGNFRGSFLADAATTNATAVVEDGKSAWQYLHWVVVNIPGSTRDIANGDVVATYAAPNPPQGNHRYAFILFEQTFGKVAPPAITERGAFDTRKFAKDQFLKPVGGTFFFCQPQA